MCILSVGQSHLHIVVRLVAYRTWFNFNQLTYFNVQVRTRRFRVNSHIQVYFVFSKHVILNLKFKEIFSLIIKNSHSNLPALSKFIFKHQCTTVFSVTATAVFMYSVVDIFSTEATNFEQSHVKNASPGLSIGAANEPSAF